MADELELLKKHWQQQEETLPRLTAKEIYPMLLKKSSSIVKWIFFISLFEFLFWVAITLFPILPELDGQIEQFHLKLFNTIMLIVQFTGLAFFIGLFYYNYKKITATDSASVLMKNILKTRKTVKYYIWFNLLLLGAGLVIAFGIVLSYDTTFMEGKSMTTIILLLSIVTAVTLGIVWLFYRIVYGILARRLQANYKELKKLEV